MIVTHLETDARTKKVKVYIDGNYSFFLSKKELDLYKLEEGQELSNQLYNDIIENIIIPRAKEKALSILDYSDKTETELKHKLVQAGYNSDIIERTIDYLKAYSYINDERYAAGFIRSNKQRKSKLAITALLSQKGVDKSVINRAMSEEYYDDSGNDYEFEAIKKAVSKKVTSVENLDYTQKQKLIASLCRKGFDPDKVMKVLDYML